jgi:hypothetical protein
MYHIQHGGLVADGLKLELSSDLESLDAVSGHHCRSGFPSRERHEWVPFVDQRRSLNTSPNSLSWNVPTLALMQHSDRGICQQGRIGFAKLQ